MTGVSAAAANRLSYIHFGRLNLEGQRLWAPPTCSSQKQARMSAVLNKLSRDHPDRAALELRLNPPPGFMPFPSCEERRAFQCLYKDQQRLQRQNKVITVAYKASEQTPAEIICGVSVCVGKGRYNRKQQNGFALDRLNNRPLTIGLEPSQMSGYVFLKTIRRMIYENRELSDEFLVELAIELIQQSVRKPEFLVMLRRAMNEAKLQ